MAKYCCPLNTLSAILSQDPKKPNTEVRGLLRPSDHSLSKLPRYLLWGGPSGPELDQTHLCPRGLVRDKAGMWQILQQKGNPEEAPLI